MIGLQMLGVVLLATVAILPGVALTVGFMDLTVRRGWHFVPTFAGSMFIALSYCVAASLVLTQMGLHPA